MLMKLMKKPSLALLVALALPAAARADAPPAPPPSSIAPNPTGAPTLVRITPLQGTVVFIQDADGVVGRFTEAGMMTIPSGRTYQLSAMRGNTPLWVGRITTDGRETSVVWSGGIEPKITVATPTAPPPGPAPPIAVPQRPSPMKSPQFEAWIQSLQVEAFDNNRVDMVRRIAAREWFTTAQVARTMDVFNFENNRMNAMEVLRDRITDPENSLVLAQRFHHAANRKRALEILTSPRR